MCEKNRSHHCIKAVAKLALLSVSTIALAAAGVSAGRAPATPPAEQGSNHKVEAPTASPPGTPARTALSPPPPAEGAPRQDAPTTQPDASSAPATPAQQQSIAPALPAVTV